MWKNALLASLLAGASLLAATGSASAQECAERAGEATAPSKDAAMTGAYEAVLKAVDPNLLRAWSTTSRKIGEAPGYSIRKMTAQCRAGGQGQICRIVATICRG